MMFDSRWNYTAVYKSPINLRINFLPAIFKLSSFVWSFIKLFTPFFSEPVVEGYRATGWPRWAPPAGRRRTPRRWSCSCSSWVVRRAFPSAKGSRSTPSQGRWSPPHKTSPSLWKSPSPPWQRCSTPPEEEEEEEPASLSIQNFITDSQSRYKIKIKINKEMAEPTPPGPRWEVSSAKPAVLPLVSSLPVWRSET